MDMDSAAVFLAGTILYSLGGLVILIALVCVNNIIHTFWKNLGWTLMPHWTEKRFATEDEMAKSEPKLKDPTH